MGFAVGAIAYPLLRNHRFEWLQTLTHVTAGAEYHLFRLFVSDVSVAEHALTIGGFNALIIVECTGLFEALIFAAAVWAAPARWQEKAVGIGLGIPLLFLINVVRLATLIAIGRYFPGGFQFAHQYLWQGVWIFVVIGVWLLWVVVVVRNEEAVPDLA